MADKCLPFFKALKDPFNWTEECQKAFEKVKEYLSSPPMLVSPRPGDELQLYIAATDETVAAALVKEEHSKQLPIYYVSKVLQPAEQNYSRMEKLVLALVTAARKLRPYFQAHKIMVITDQPIKEIMQKTDCSGRMIKWNIELSEFGLEYEKRKAIKAQALADFVAECSFEKEDHEFKPTSEQHKEAKDETWKLFVDGSSAKDNAGAGVLLVDPEGVEWKYGLTFSFNPTNNEAEYEALIAGLELALQLKVKNIIAYSDSQLVAKQVAGEYAIKGETLKKYLHKVRSQIVQFTKFQLEQVSREENKEADDLSRFTMTLKIEKRGRLLIEHKETPSYQSSELCNIEEEEPNWTTPLRRYFKTSLEPEEGKEKFRKMVTRYVV